MGKTAVLTTAMRNMAEAGQKPLLISLEQPVTQLVARMLADKSNISLEKFDLPGAMTQSNTQSWHLAIADMENLDFYIDDRPGQTIKNVRETVTKLHEEKGITVVLIDYLQLIKSERGNRMRYLEIDEVLQGLHELARETGLPILMGAQLSREVFHRKEKRPILSDLRESGNIEQFSYSITFLHRDDYWDDMTLNKGVAELIVAKHRQGPTGIAKAVFVAKYSRLENLALKPLHPPTIPAAPPQTASI